MHKFLRFLPAWTTGFVLASLAQTHAVLWELNSLGITIALSDWLFMIGQDAKGLLPTYGSIIAITLALSFTFVHLVIFSLKKRGKTLFNRLTSTCLFALAGGLGFLLMLLAMQPILDVTLIAGARSLMGFTAQCLSGAAAGWVYARLQPTYN